MSLARQANRLAGLTVHKDGGLWEAVEGEQLARFLKAFKVDCVFDVGANAGQYASRLREIGYRGRILSFEPNPSLTGKLITASARDALWEIYATALDSEPREMLFNVMKRDTFSSLHTPDHTGTSLFTDMNAIDHVVKIRTETLDNLFPKLKDRFEFERPFLKMDTQGHDLSVVEGASLVMERFVGIQSELSVVSLYEGAPSYIQTIEAYQGRGFKLTAFLPNNAGHFPDLNEMDCLMYNPSFRPAS